MTAIERIIAIAQKQYDACDNADRKHNAYFGLADAKDLASSTRGAQYARARALTSLKFSVGILHPAYAEALTIHLSTES